MRATSFRRPVSVLVVVHTDDGQTLLLRRKQPFDFWQSVTGSLHPGEVHSAAAARELTEETGLSQEGSLAYSGVSRQFVIDARWRDRFAPGRHPTRDSLPPAGALPNLPLQTISPGTCAHHRRTVLAVLLGWL